MKLMGNKIQPPFRFLSKFLVIMMVIFSITHILVRTIFPNEIKILYDAVPSFLVGKISTIFWITLLFILLLEIVNFIIMAMANVIFITQRMKEFFGIVILKNSRKIHLESI